MNFCYQCQPQLFRNDWTDILNAEAAIGRLKATLQNDDLDVLADYIGHLKRVNEKMME
jgi:hypothetical protein